MSLTVLTDNQIRLILETLTVERLDEFRASLSGALYDYSTNAASIEDGTYQQPHRLAVNNPKTGAATLFMPSVCPSGMGVKVVTLSAPPQQQKTKQVSDGDSRHTPPETIRPTGAITLLSPTGQPTAFLHASTLTAFRTALSSTCLLARRRPPRVITAFGSGLQSYWHIRLALKMHGPHVLEVHVVARAFSDKAREILERFLTVPAEIKALEGWTDVRFSLVTPAHRDFVRLRAECVRAADVLFCCTPSTEDLFRAETLLCKEARTKGRLVVAVGSYTPEMRELPKELLHQATGRQYGQGQYDRLANNALDGGVIVVDTLEGVMKEAGEIIEARISPTQLVELGEVVKLPKPPDEIDSDRSTPTPMPTPSSEFERLDLRSRSEDAAAAEEPPGAAQAPTPVARPRPQHRLLSGRPQVARAVSYGVVDAQRKEDDARARWLRDGNVIYKSVGLGLMDLVVGNHMVKVAREMGVGTTIDDF